MSYKKQFSRRNVVKAVGGTGLFALAQGTASAEEDKVEIVTVRGRGGRVQQTKKVPKSWWRQEQKARRVKETLWSRYNSDRENDVVSVSIGTTNEKTEGKKRSKIIIRDQAEQGIDSTIPQDVDGIPVETAEKLDITPDCGEVEVDWMNGGRPVARTDANGPGSATCAVEHMVRYT